MYKSVSPIFMFKTCHMIFLVCYPLPEG